MDRVLRYFLRQFIRHGAITFTTASGARFDCGDGTGEPVAVRFLTTDAERRVLLNPELALGEAYMDGNFVVDHGAIADVLAILLGQPEILPRWAKLQWGLRYLVRHAQQFNPRGRSRHNVERHYDLDGRLYSLFLDADKQYSCAYFEVPDVTLEDAQLAKKRHLTAKLLVSRGHRVLDIGSGWGGLGLYLAEMTGAEVTGVTLSAEQLAISNARAAEKNLSAKFLLEDYRDIPGAFDRIVSVGMFEHVGVDFYETFFRRCAELLTDDGVMVLHSIGRSLGPDVTNSWIAKYIFPGGYIPALSEVAPAIERAGLLVRYRSPARALRRNAESVARAFCGAARGGGAALRRSLCADVGVLSGVRRNVIPQAGPDELSVPARQARGRRTDHARLHRSRGSAAARRRIWPATKIADRRGMRLGPLNESFRRSRGRQWYCSNHSTSSRNTRIVSRDRSTRKRIRRR